MSRIGRRPVELPEKVTAKLDGSMLTVEGPLGKLDTQLPEGMSVVIADTSDSVSGTPKDKRGRGFLGLTRALVANMVVGVTKGYEKKLEINGVGYKAELKGKSLSFYLGYSHGIDMEIPEGISAIVDKQTSVTVSGIDKQLVGQVAAKIRAFKIPEPYKAKGVKYADEVVVRKVGKTGAK